MGHRARALLGEALQLPLEERAAMAAELLASMDGPLDEEAEAAWDAEIERRANRALAGEPSGITREDAQARISDRLRQP